MSAPAHELQGRRSSIAVSRTQQIGLFFALTALTILALSRSL